jgi:hypothetical protein
LASICTVLSLFVVSVPQGFAQTENSVRVVAVGDVHGSFDGLVSILQAAGLIDEDSRWVGGDAVLVQTGDLLDRGPEVRQVMDLLMRLQTEAAAAGGTVHCLIGNDEAMNLVGILRDVSSEVYSAFADESSEWRREKAWKAQKTVMRKRAKRSNVELPNLDDAIKQRWMSAFPLGALEYVDALSSSGLYGSWLRSFPIAVVVDDTLFVHGGLGSATLNLDVDQLNSRLADELRTYDRVKSYLVKRKLVLPWSSLQEVVREGVYEQQRLSNSEDAARLIRSEREILPLLDGMQGWNDWFLISDDGPLWFRGAAKWDEHRYEATLNSVLEKHGVNRVVAGHTVQARARIEGRFGGRVILIDTGMLASHYHGQPSALEITGQEIYAIYADGRARFEPEPTKKSTSSGGPES